MGGNKKARENVKNVIFSGCLYSLSDHGAFELLETKSHKSVTIFG